jgi:competence ComEA-like helix-hairpin-helix protein
MIRMMTAIALVLGLVGATGVAAQEAPRSSAKASAPAGAPINLNTATVAQLETLPGIGKSTAERILEYRQKNGGFKKVEEILEHPRSCPCLLNISYEGAPAAVSRSR